MGMNKMIVYISGPISGIKDDNAPAFFEAEEELAFLFSDGPNFQVVNPIRLAESVRESFKDISKVLKKEIEPEWEDYMRRCIAELSNCTHVLFLDGWGKSRGALVEFYIASVLQIPCFFSLSEMQEKLLA